MVTYNEATENLVWKALADNKRRMIVDALAQRELTTGDIVNLVPEIGRTAVLKHIDVLHAADLVRFRRDGRKRWNQLNPQPLKYICAPWLTRHIEGVTRSAQALKRLAETGENQT